MATKTAAGASRQTAIAGAVAGLHVGAFILAASGMAPRLMEAVPTLPPVYWVEPPPKPFIRERPDPVASGDYRLEREPAPVVVIPRIQDALPAEGTGSGNTAETAGGGPGEAEVTVEPPALRLRDSRVAALIDACYPAASRRMGEEGRATAHIVVDAAGSAREWAITQGTGFPRLDAALDCVIPRLQFHPGRRDGRAVAAEVRLPVVFQLN